MSRNKYDGKGKPAEDPRATFFIEFSTEDGPGILATKVTIEEVYVTDMDASFQIGCPSPALYRKLEKYVLANHAKGQLG